METAGFEKKVVEQQVGFMKEEEEEESVRPAPDDFSVDDLLDFPENNDSETDLVVSAGIKETKPCLLAEVSGDGGFYPTADISVPAADVAELEWLSHFVEDSFSDYYSLAYSALEKKTKLESKTVAPATTNSERLFPPPVTKPRGKRSRSSGKSWALSDTTSSSSSGSPLKLKSALKPPPSKRLNRRVDGGGLQNPRRCSHCGVQKTPQWRAGPRGAKTLCNACGVRFKSGRLCPEYRPACSPTFSSELHSNQHRKVVEMRRKKEEVGMGGLGPAVPTF